MSAKSTTPVPEWHNRRLFLVDPALWAPYRRRDGDLRPLYRELITALDSLGVESRVLTRIDAPLDIWIRDWGFIGQRYFRFEPSYAKGFYSRAALRRARAALSRQANGAFPLMPLMVEGGNLVHDGQTAILTEKVLSDNRHLTRREIERAIVARGFQRVVFIPSEPDDTIGHADGIVRFLRPGVLLFNDYRGLGFVAHRRRLLRVLRRAEICAELVPFPWFSTDEKHDGVWSAEGCYINFILTERGIVLPAFNHPLDHRAAEILAKHTSLPIRTVNARALARFGGVLNCISLTW